LPNATQFAAYSTGVTATGGAGGYSFTACPGNTVGVQCLPGTVALPAGLNLDPSGLISGTVTAGPGRYAFTVTATDTDHVSYSRLIPLDVIGTPPTLPNIGLYGGFFEDCSFGIGCTRSLFVGSGGEAPFTWTAVGLPPGIGIRFGSGITSQGTTPGDGEIWGR